MDYAAQYGKMHAKGKYFPGYSVGAYADVIAELVKTHKPEKLLDYGSGQGFQYLKRRVHERWGGLLPYCYDIGVRHLSEKPEGKFGGVICTDMMEHIERGDVPGILDELLAYVEVGGFLILGISCRPTRKTLPDGRDVHVTIEPPHWWIDQIENAVARYRETPKSLMPGMGPHVVAIWDVAGHFKCDETPFDSWSTPE